MKVKELITPVIIKKINLILFPLLALIFILAGVFIYRLRSEQAMRSGKLQARISSLNMLEFVKNEMLNYINVCVSYSSMAEMHNEVEFDQQVSYLSQLTQYVLQNDKNVLALRCYLNEAEQGTIAPATSQSIKIARSNANNEVLADIERQFYELKLLDKASLAKTNYVNITEPYSVPTVNAQGQNETYNVLTFYKAIRNGNNDMIGQACVDVLASKIAQLLQQLQHIAQTHNCTVSLYLNEDNKFISLAEAQTIALIGQPDNIPAELMTIVNDGYDAEYDDTHNSQYFFIVPARLPNFNSKLTIIASFSHSELTKSISDFTTRLLIIMAVAYIIIIALLFYTNKYLYKKFTEADITMLNSNHIDIQAEDIS